MTAHSTSFLHLPREVREMVYDVAFENIEHSSLYNSGTAYTKDSSPLLYVHESITEDLQPRLYRDHTIVLPLQEPSEFVKGEDTVAHHLEKVSRMMKNRATTIIIEAAQTGRVYETDEENTSGGEPEEDYDFWHEEQGGVRFAKKITQELLSMKAQLPSATRVKLIFWFGKWVTYSQHWKSQLAWLKKQWDELEVEIQLNLFDFDDPDAGDGGSNWIQCWKEEYKDTPYIDFSAIDLSYNDHQSGQYTGMEFDPAGWEDPYVNTMSTEEKNEILHSGARVECRPLFVKPGPGDN
ncbi:hypothetical protein G7Z17_g2911 [Cylindrodendrum hubeiense]|uniref:Uncharacterized protein n=1 Tax=Cylindrodendrum hubeiense TaxID=595255 RepID=A0A9P5LB90_9HYPO|nr:hypothetical protein G7Z17_g2911 [Cylindrodendrum hubeiense]